MLTMIILYSTIDLHFPILWIFLLSINPQAEMHCAPTQASAMSFVSGLDS